MAATETIRIVLHAQARSGFCCPCISQASDRSERSPPKVGVVGSCGRNACQRGLVVRMLSLMLDVHDRHNSALDIEITTVAGRCSDHKRGISPVVRGSDAPSDARRPAAFSEHHKMKGACSAR
jgi:hypothetical protein